MISDANLKFKHVFTMNLYLKNITYGRVKRRQDSIMKVAKGMVVVDLVERKTKVDGVDVLCRCKWSDQVPRKKLTDEKFL